MIAATSRFGGAFVRAIQNAMRAQSGKGKFLFADLAFFAIYGFVIRSRSLSARYLAVMNVFRLTVIGAGFSPTVRRESGAANLAGHFLAEIHTALSRLLPPYPLVFAF